MHTTCAVFINEFQKALLSDIKRFLEKMVARDGYYLHNDPDHSDCDRMNADSHLRAMLLGHTLTLQISGGEVVLGQWQRILMAELDGPRSRTLRVRSGASPKPDPGSGPGTRRVLGRRAARIMRDASAPPGFATSPTSSTPASACRFEDGVRLFAAPDLLAVGWLANRERERRHGDRTYFNYNLRLEATNVCEASCLFCSFARLKPGKPGAHTLSLEQVLDKLRGARRRAAHRGPHRQRPASRTCRSATTRTC